MTKFLFLTLTLTASILLAQGDDKQTLIGGKPVPSGSFNPVVRIAMSGGSCSATIVADRVLITAAHCARGGQRVTFSHNRNRYSAICEGHPSYPRTDLDVALCLIDKPVLEVKAASIDFRGVKRQDVITMTGYGCIKPGGGGGNDGILRYGDTTVTGFSTVDIISRGGVAACFGDSGSGVFQKVTDMSAHLYQVGVVSKGNIRDTSYIANLAMPTYKTWMQSYEQRVKQEICGLSKVCDMGQEEPEDPKDPEEKDCRFEQKLLDFFSAQTAWAQTELDKCQAK